MASYPDIVGHERPIALLERARRTGRVAHAYLFHGPDGVGKERVALAFARALLCADESNAPCGRCENCTRVERGVHPDLRLVACEAELVERGLAEAESSKAASLQIRKEQLDELGGLLRHRPYLGRWKVVIVVDAERMNPNAQNRFLKTLEEPTDDTVILLITSRPDALLSTVRSRCQALSFGPLARSRVAEVLVERTGAAPERAAVLAAMAQGSLGLALELAETDRLVERDAVTDALGRARVGDLAELLDAANSLSEGKEGRQQAETALELFELWCRDLLFVRLGVGQSLLINRDRLEALAEAALRIGPHSLVRWLDRVRQTRGALRGNANPRLAMEALLLDMRGS